MTKVAVITGGQRTPVPRLGDEDPVVVPAQNLLIEIEAERRLGAEVLLDESRLPVVRGATGTSGYVLVDCFRSTGFHRLLVDGVTYCFGTEDAKLQLDGIVSILEMIEEEGLSWGNQIIFSDGCSIRDPRVDFAWLQSNATQLFEICESIANRPATKQRAVARRSHPRRGRALIGKTMSLLRSDPRGLLEEHPRGVINADRKRWMPRYVVADLSETSHDTIANRRVTRLLLDVLELAKGLIALHEMPRNQIRQVDQIVEQIRSNLDRVPFRLLKQLSVRISDSPSPPERTDPRYQQAFHLHQQLRNTLGWDPSRQLSDRFAYVGYSDEIYQAFVATLLGDAFEAPRTRTHLAPDLMHPAFQSEDWEIYYDTAPPVPSYTSWRDGSIRPARLTPDYCIVDRKARKGLLGDAKYRAGKNGRLPNSALNECQVYMQHFGVTAFVVFYPGPEPLMEAIEGEGNTILMVALSPFNHARDWVKREVRPRIESLLQRLSDA